MDTNLTEIIFLIDKSGSMWGLTDDTAYLARYDPV